jgi:hypothetical protein
VTGNLASGVAEIHHACLIRDLAQHEDGRFIEVVDTGPHAVPGVATRDAAATSEGSGRPWPEGRTALSDECSDAG